MMRISLFATGALMIALGVPAGLEAQTRPIRSGPTLAFIPGTQPPSPRRCAWPFIVDASNINLAYPDPNATYWAMPFSLGADESITVAGTYPSARFMAVTVYTVAGDTVAQLSDLDIAPDQGSANPFAVADPPPGSGRSWRLVVVPAGSTATGNVVELAAGQRSGWLVYRTYLGNPPGDLTGGVALPTLVRSNGTTVTQTLAPCATFLPGTAIAAILNATLPEPVDVTSPTEFVRIAQEGGLFANDANAYLSAFSDAPAGQILVVRGLLPTAPDTEAGESVVGDFELRYFSITSNLNQKPYPTIDGYYDHELPLDDAGYYTVVIARDGDVPSNATAANDVAVLSWGDGASQTVLIRNMLPAAAFTMAVQDVTPTDYGAASDAATVMVDFYPVIGTCTTATFEAEGAAGCLPDAP
jgi:hypothetical protein